MSASIGTVDFKRAMLPVATELLGEPNAALSTQDEKRWGTRGSLAVDVRKGVWTDHEDGGKGGGVIDLVMREKSTDKTGALEFLAERGFIERREVGSSVIEATYDYADEHGELLFQVCRFQPKDFRQRKPDGSGKWSWTTRDVRKVVFHLPNIVNAVAANRVIYVVEGEKSVLAMEHRGLVATCSPGGAGKWRKEYNETFRGAQVVVLPDNDPQAATPTGEPRWHPDGRPVLPGQDHAADVARNLQGIAASVQILMLPGLPPKGDVVDFFGAGGTAEDLEGLVREHASHPIPEPEVKTQLPPAPESDNGASDIQAAVNQVIESFNARYSVVNEAGKAVIFQYGYDPVLKRRRIDRLSPRDLQTLYMNALVKVGEDEKGRPCLKSKANIWLGHCKRRQYIDGVIFDPSTTHAPPGVLNLWQGFAVKPKLGRWNLLREHVLSIVCGSDALRFDYLMGWMARVIQHPAERGETSVVLKGIEGCGKGILARALLKLAGHHGMAITDAKHLVGSFNAHLRDTVFLFADEAFFAGDRAHVGVLKSLITEPMLTTHPEQVDNIRVFQGFSVQGVHPPCTLTEVNVTGDPSADADYELGRQIGVLFAELATTVVTAVGLLDAGLIVEARELLSCRVECPPPPAVRAYLRRKLD